MRVPRIVAAALILMLPLPAAAQPVTLTARYPANLCTAPQNGELMCGLYPRIAVPGTYREILHRLAECDWIVIRHRGLRGDFVCLTPRVRR